MNYRKFIIAPVAEPPRFSYVSLFSGAGLGDYGLQLAGGICLGAVELDPNRALVHKENLQAPLWGNIRKEKDILISALKGSDVDLVIATPPCQGFSTANAKRGLREDPAHASRDERNNLFFEALYVIRALKPKIVLFENVPNFLKRQIRTESGISGPVGDFLRASLGQYVSWTNVICLSELGIPQRRIRSVAIFIRNDIRKAATNGFPELLKPLSWPAYPNDAPSNILDALDDLPALDGKSSLDAKSANDFLHQVPDYPEYRYKWISAIPPLSGKSAWENACEECGDASAPFGTIICLKCGSSMRNRPHVIEKDTIRPIRGFKTSYKRMSPNEIAPTITTTSGTFSSDLKLHPEQNRVLSARECARLQAIPDSFKWPSQLNFKKGSLFRDMIGEAVPPLVTYRFGMAAREVLTPEGTI
jgi:DNA (cytosine-5)-methyltransferase 1